MEAHVLDAVTVRIYLQHVRARVETGLGEIANGKGISVAPDECGLLAHPFEPQHVHAGREIGDGVHAVRSVRLRCLGVLEKILIRAARQGIGAISASERVVAVPGAHGVIA